MSENKNKEGGNGKGAAESAHPIQKVTPLS